MTDSTPTDTIAPILGKVTSGVYILTARHGDNETGMLASWVMQAGFEPPTVTVAVKNGRYVLDWLDTGETFALNVVGESGKSLLGHFGRGFEPGEPAFDGLDIERGQDDVPLLTAGTIGYLLCKPTGSLDSADHRVFSAEVIGGTLRGDERPMVHVRNSGAHY
jgi:flavin reductase (DIM6/NTAB) family NADH-FMN oxidoreductase RutF